LQPITSVSFSRFEDYLKCPRLFYHKYVLKDPAITASAKQEPLLQGSLAHLLIERRLEIQRDLDQAETLNVLSTWLKDDCKLAVSESYSEMDLGVGIDLQSLYDCASQISSLLDRCASWYSYEDTIRSKSGDLLADPLNYPSISFRMELDKLKIDSLRSCIDVTAGRLDPDFTSDVKLTSAAARGLHFGLNFTPASNANTVAIEYDLSVERIEAAPDVIWRGFIDWIYTDEDGLHLIDHKTSKALPTEALVMHHEQLNIYAYLYYLTTGVWADTIGINSLPTQQIISVSLDRNLSKEIYDYYCGLAIEICQPNRQWHRQPPTNIYHSNCARKFGKDVRVCKLVPTCWPHFDPLSLNL
jgi:hypothetical protein